MALLTGGLLLISDLIIGQVVEPLVYGHGTGLSPIAVILSTVFWTWLWRPLGLLLAIPLTVCLVVLGRHVEGLNFLEVLFGDEREDSQGRKDSRETRDGSSEGR